MQLILKCYSSNEEFSGDCDWAWLDLTPELATRLLKRVAWLRYMRREPDAETLTEMVYTEEVVDYFSAERLTLSGLDADQARELREEIDEKLSRDQLMLAPGLLAGMAVKNRIRWARADADRVVAREDAVSFTCRTGNAEITTADVSALLLERVISSAAEVIHA